MKLAYIAAILGVFLCFPHAKAMEEKEADRKSITVRGWEPSEKIPNGHISLETEKFHISLHPPTTQTFFKPNIQRDMTHAFATHSFQADKEYLGDPTVTYSFSLTTQPIHDMWVKIADITLLEKHGFMKPDTIGYLLPKVVYFDRLTTDQEVSHKNNLLYLNDRSLVQGLLYVGKINEPRFSKYFNWISPANCISSFIDISETNIEVANMKISLQEVINYVKWAVRKETLLKVGEEIEKRKMTFLNTHHKEEIRARILEKSQDFQAISTHLLELETAYQSDQSYLSPTGWVHWVKGEWKTGK